MSRALVNMLSTMNVFIALIIIGAGALWGNAYLPKAGVIFGAVVGFAAASIICGALAALCLIEKHLRVLADDLRQQRRRVTPASRAEPSMK